MIISFLLPHKRENLIISSVRLTRNFPTLSHGFLLPFQDILLLLIGSHKAS